LVEKTGVPRENHRPATPLINLNMLHTDTRTTGTKRILGADWRDRDRNVAGWYIYIYIYIYYGRKRKFKQWWPIIPPMSTKLTAISRVNILNIENSRHKKLKIKVLSLDRRSNGEESSIGFRISKDKWFVLLFSDHRKTCHINNHPIKWKLTYSASLDGDSCNVTNCLYL